MEYVKSQVIHHNGVPSIGFFDFCTFRTYLTNEINIGFRGRGIAIKPDLFDLEGLKNINKPTDMVVIRMCSYHYLKRVVNVIL